MTASVDPTRDSVSGDDRSELVDRQATDASMVPLGERLSLAPEDAAIFIGIKSATLKKWRSVGEGPAYIKAGSRIVYLVEDLEDFLRGRRVA